MSQETIQPSLTQKEFNRVNKFNRVKSVPFLTAVKTESDWSVRSVFLSLFPIFTWLPEYKCKANITADLLSGFTVAVMHVPQGMAYAALANVNPIVGLYMAVFPTLTYVIMGTSRHISLGSFSITCLMAARPVMAYSTKGGGNSTNSTSDPGDGSYNYNYNYSPMEVASVLCVSVGMFQMLLGFVKAGHLSVFLSKPIVSGLTTGAAVLVFISQLPHVFGIKLKQYIGTFSAVYSVLELVERLPETNTVALTTSLAVMFCLLIFTDCIDPWLKWKLKLPIELIVMIVGALISFLFDFKIQYNIHVVGNIPTGLPGPTIPQLQLMMVPNFLFESIAIAIICFSISISMATIFAMKDHYKINPNQELFAYGFGNIFGGFFPCLPIAASLSRSAIQHTTGGKTQLVTIFSSLFLIFIMVYLGKYLDPLPYCVLAGIVIKSLKSMLLQVTQLPTFWRESSADGVIWILIFVSVILLGILYGIGFAFILAILSIILMNQKTYVCLLGQVPQSDLYLEMRRYQIAKPVPGMMLVQIYAGLHFANIKVCIDRIEYLLKKTSMTGGVNIVILVFSAVLFTDPEALETLTVYISDLQRRGINVCLAGCTGRVYEAMNKCKFFDKFSEDLLFPSIHSAVVHYQEINKKSVVVEETTLD